MGQRQPSRETWYVTPPSGPLYRGTGGISGGPRPPSRPSGLTLLVRPMSLVLWGDTRTGKTSWARSLGTHLYFCGLYSYREAKNARDAHYAIFDDIQGGIKFFHSFKNWLGCQANFQIKGLYRDPELIAWGKPCIWLSNTDPRLDLSYSDVTWMDGNCSFVEITTPLI